MKPRSDIFICKLETGEYWAYPSPFVAHRRRAKIQFRNLTGDSIEIDFGAASLNGKILKLASNAKGVVTLGGKATPGLYEYVGTVVGQHRIMRGSGKRMPVLVKGGSPPQIIVDT